MVTCSFPVSRRIAPCPWEKPDENSGVAWFTPEEALAASTEPWMVQRVYRKLADRAAAYMKT